MSLVRAMAAFLVLGAGVSLAARDSAAEKVGVAAAVNPDAFSGSGGARKELRIGKSIFYNERIGTDANGVVQVLLVDGSTFTVGRNSNVVIDRFVYDPKKKSGEIVTSFSKGSMRYIGGKISKNPGGVTVNTPNGSLAIRGGMVQGTIGPGGSIFSFLYGREMTFTGSNGQTYTVYQPGYTLDLSSGIPTIRPTTAADIDLVMANLTNSNTDTSGVNTENTPPRPEQLVNTLSLQQLIIDATGTRIAGELLEQLRDLQDIPNTLPPTAPTDDGQPIVRSSIGGFGAGLVYSQSFYEYTTALSTSPGDFAFDDKTGAITLRLYDAEGGGAVQSGVLRFVPDSGHWTLASTQLFGTNNQPLQVFSSNGYVAAEPGNLCSNCDFIKWGEFGVEFTYLDPLDNFQTTDQIALGWWVGGQVTDFRDLPQTGTASYKGTVVGSITSSNYYYGPQVVGRGDLGMTWDFAKRSGQFNIKNFGPSAASNPQNAIPTLNAGGTMTMPGNFNKFSGSLGGMAGQIPVSGGANGAFVTDGRHPAAGVIGNWGVKGGDYYNGYRATGVFGGARRP